MHEASTCIMIKRLGASCDAESRHPCMPGIDQQQRLPAHAAPALHDCHGWLRPQAQASSLCVMHAGAIHQELARRNTVLLYSYSKRGSEELVLGYLV